MQKGENMINNVQRVWENIGTSTISVMSTSGGKYATVSLFLTSLFAPISGILVLLVVLVSTDFMLGCWASVKTKGKGSLLSNKYRNSFYKLSFYAMFIFMAFFIEREIYEEMCFGPKVIFAVISAVEMWSIAANALIIYPEFPFLKLFKKFLTSEISKKLEIDNQEVDDILMKREVKQTLENTNEILDNQKEE